MARTCMDGRPARQCWLSFKVRHFTNDRVNGSRFEAKIKAKDLKTKAKTEAKNC